MLSRRMNSFLTPSEDRDSGEKPTGERDRVDDLNLLSLLHIGTGMPGWHRPAAAYNGPAGWMSEW